MNTQKKLFAKSRFARVVAFFGDINSNPKVVLLRYRIAEPLTAGLIWIGVRPTPLNLLGLLSGLASAFLVARGRLSGAAIALAISIAADGLDGMVARSLGLDSDFGIFFDSVCDRYVDTSVLLGLSWLFTSQSAPLYTFLTYMAVTGTVVTSYSRARAESLGLSSRYIGFMNRPERVLLLLLAFIFPTTLRWVVWTLAIFCNVTAIHRIWFYSILASKTPSRGVDKTGE